MDMMLLVEILVPPVVAGLISYCIYLHKSFNAIDARMDNMYPKSEVENLIKLHMQSAKERCLYLDSRVSRLDTKVDRVIELYSQQSKDG